MFDSRICVKRRLATAYPTGETFLAVNERYHSTVRVWYNIKNVLYKLLVNVHTATYVYFEKIPGISMTFSTFYSNVRKTRLSRTQVWSSSAAITVPYFRYV